MTNINVDGAQLLARNHHRQSAIKAIKLFDAQAHH